MDLSNYMRNKMNIHDNMNSDNEEVNIDTKSFMQCLIELTQKMFWI